MVVDLCISSIRNIRRLHNLSLSPTCCPQLPIKTMAVHKPFIHFNTHMVMLIMCSLVQT